MSEGKIGKKGMVLFYLRNCALRNGHLVCVNQ